LFSKSNEFFLSKIFIDADVTTSTANPTLFFSLNFSGIIDFISLISLNKEAVFKLFCLLRVDLSVLKLLIFLEDESLNIGSVFMPEPFFQRIREAVLIALICKIETRLPRLLEEYGKMPHDELENSISRIRKRLGGKETDEALEALTKGNMQRAIEIVLHYYDKSYTYGLGKRDPAKVIRLESGSRDASVNADRILRTADSLVQ